MVVYDDYEDKPTLDKDKLMKLTIEQLKDLLGLYDGPDWKLIRKVMHEKKFPELY